MQTIVSELQAIQKRRATLVKTIVAAENHLRSVVAMELGYCPGMSKEDREKKFNEADNAVSAIRDGVDVDGLDPDIVKGQLLGIHSLKMAKSRLEKPMLKLAKSLPAFQWVKHPDQRGFGELNFAIVIGECGNLSNYPNPAKVWKRMGCAPWSFKGCTAMGATWKSEYQRKANGLPAIPTGDEGWTGFGYSPRRRSIAYLIGECLLKANKGPYRDRYDATKAGFAVKHPDATPRRCHLHGMLLATKLILKNLWIEWNR